MEKIEAYYKDIFDLTEFNKNGYHYSQVIADRGNNIYIYKMEHIGEPLSYCQFELVRGIKRKNPDGTVVNTYPSTENFGTYAWYICGTEESCWKRIAEKVKVMVDYKEA